MVDKVDTLQGEERIEGEFWKIYWLADKTGDLDYVRSLANDLLSNEPESLISRIFLEIICFSTQYFDGNYYKALETLDKAGRLIMLNDS